MRSQNQKDYPINKQKNEMKKEKKDEHFNYGLSQCTRGKQQVQFKIIKNKMNQNQVSMRTLHRSKSGISLSHGKAIIFQKLYQQIDFDKHQKPNEQELQNMFSHKQKFNTKDNTKSITTKASSPSLTNYSANRTPTSFDVKDLKRQIQRQRVFNQYYQAFDVKTEQTQKNFKQKQKNFKQTQKEVSEYHKTNVPYRKGNLKLTLKDSLNK